MEELFNYFVLRTLFTMLQNLRILLLLSWLAATGSCDDKDRLPQPDKLELLKDSSWLGPVETERIDLDTENNVVYQSKTDTREGNYSLYALYPDQTCLIKNLCDKTLCTGDVHNGKWSLTNNTLLIAINREDINSLADFILVEAEVAHISTTELIVENIFSSPTSSVHKRISRAKFVKYD